uniref:Uncharacterized protein n=1 Tax=Marseillevirus LCMAC202 TaxID=2506606 RepID=A0A481YZ43_9VIRU|nr:MAG: hypothetical protein LCMAC202_05530 [Marseillevirus LCMAC202]
MLNHLIKWTTDFGQTTPCELGDAKDLLRGKSLKAVFNFFTFTLSILKTKPHYLKMDHTGLNLLSSALLFYWCHDKLLGRYLDQIPQAPPITEAFEKIIEIVTPGAVITPSDEEVFRERIPLPMIVVEGDPLLQHFIGTMFAVPPAYQMLHFL